MIRFSDVTAESGIDMVMTCGATPSTQIVEVNGGGLALIDHDDDGDWDLFVANGATIERPEEGPGCRLFENLGGLRFRDVTEASGITLRRWAMGATAGDADGDGRDDLFVACLGNDALLRNLGGGRFADVTAPAGLSDDRWSTSAAFADLDGDADLDLYVVNYLDFDLGALPPRTTYKGVSVMSGPHGLQPTPDRLFRNLGDGRFEDASAASGILREEPAFGLNLIILDLDDDGDQDIYVANDSMANFLFRNQGGMVFESAAMSSGCAANADGATQASMGLAVADVDGNGRPDLFTTNFSSDTNTLYTNADGRFFDDRTQTWGLGMVSRTFLGWACGFFDFDHDADEDLVILNGHVYPEATSHTMDSEYLQTPLLFRRVERRYEVVDAREAGPWLARRASHRGAVFGDLDGDGDVDMITADLNGPLRVLRNDVPAGGRWLIVRLRDGRPGVGNHRGLGSRIELRGRDRVQRRWLASGGGFQSSSAPEAHFAVAADAGPWTLRVTWPDGYEQTIEQVQVGRAILFERR
jgi:hypothetical protein